MVRLRILLLSLHLALFASIFLSIILKVPIVREVLGFVYLTFVPGFVLISTLKLRLNLIETILYSVGASLSLIMLIGLIANQFYPFVGIKRPLSLIPILLTISALTLTLSFKVDEVIQIKPKKLALSVLGLTLLPFLGVFGAYVFNIYNVNTLNLIVILLIAIVPILTSFKKIPQSYIPYVIYIVSFTVLYNVCLISAYLWGWDIHLLYHTTMIVYKNLYWRPSESPLLINIIVPTVYSIVTNVNLIWFYKTMFPFFVTLIPLGIYEVCRKEFSKWYISTLAPFSFIFYYVFYKSFPVKQIPAELLMILIVGLLVSGFLPKFGRTVLLTLFSFGLLVSHYGVSYFFMIVLLLMLILYAFRFSVKKDPIMYGFLAVYIVLVVGWYMFVYSSYKFSQIANLGYNILVNLANIIKSPQGRSAVTYIEYSTPTVTWRIYKYINALFVAFLSVGILRLFYSLIKNKLDCKTHTFAFLSIGAYVFLFSSIVISFGMGFDRTLEITLPILAPYVIIGFVRSVNIFETLINKVLNLNINTDINKIVKLIGIFLATYFLFNSGFMFKITDSPIPPYCIALDKKCWQSWRAFYLSEVCGVLWFKSHYSGKVAIPFTKVESIMSEFYGHGNYTLLTWGNYFVKHVPSGTHMYFSSVVVVDKGFTVDGRFLPLSRTPLYKIILNSSRIYTSGYGEGYVS